jgi:lysophospholipase L1-like esterase
MKTILMALGFLSAVAVHAQNSTAAEPAASPSAAAAPAIAISDIPRSTQMGTGPAPAGATGGGKYSPPVPANAKLPTLWIIGDSTVRNGTLGDGSNLGQWGWGAPLVAYFDPAKINVVNRAFGGTSSRSFYNGFFWKNLAPQIKPGDFVMMQFGANDNGTKGGMSGVGDETQVSKTGEVVHTFGWYLKQFIKETRDKGATPIVVSLTPHKKWSADGHLARDSMTHAGWAAEAAQETGTAYVDLNEVIARKYDELGKAKVDTLYVPSPKEALHTGWDGAVVNAGCVIAGLKGLTNDPLAGYFSAKAAGIAPVDTSKPEGKVSQN